MKKIKVLGLFLFMFTTLLYSTWDVANNTGSYKDTFFIYHDGAANSIKSPFFSTTVSHLNDISLSENSDFNEADGWRLYHAEMGDPGVIMQGLPTFSLYNEYTGILRIFVLKKADIPAYTYIALKCYYDGMTSQGKSALFALGEVENINGTKTLDKRNQIGECNFIKIYKQQTAEANWYYIDLNLLYDPTTRINTPQIFAQLYGSQVSTIDCSLDLTGSIVTSSGSSNPNYLNMGNKLITNFKNDSDKGIRLQEEIMAYSDPDNQLWKDLQIPPEAEFNLMCFASFLAENSTVTSIAKNIIPWGNVAFSAYDMLIGGGGNKSSSTAINLQGTFHGQLENIQNLITTDVFESIGCVKTMDPLYHKDLGIVNFDKSVNILKSKIMLGGIIGAYSYKLSDNIGLSNIKVNPQSGLDLQEDEVECAIEFTMYEPGTCSSFEETTGISFQEMVDSGCYSLIKTKKITGGSIGVSTYESTYLTAFIPLSQINNTAFTLPFPAKNVKFKLRTIFKIVDQPLKDPVYSMLSYETSIVESPNISEFWHHTLSQLVSYNYTPKTVQNQNITLTKKIFVEANSTLRYENCHFLSTLSDFGFYVKNGKLELVNCTFEGAGFIKVDNENSEIYIQGGSYNLNHFKIIANNKGKLTFTHTNVDLNLSSSIEMSNNSLINFLNLSSLNVDESSYIKGASGSYQIPQINPNDPFNTGGETIIEGDKLIFDNSKIIMNQYSKIIGDSNEPWDGITIINERSGLSTISAEISNLRYIVLSNSIVSFYKSNIHNIESLNIWNNSQLDFELSNYSHCASGINVDNSMIYSYCSIIENSGTDGLKISNSPMVWSIICGTVIRNNSKNGLNIRNCPVLISSLPAYLTKISNNGYNGYVNLSTSSFTEIGMANFQNNLRAEMVSLIDSWPSFNLNEGSLTILDSNLPTNQNDLDYYLIRLIGAQPSDIVQAPIIVDTSVQSRFSPNFSNFIFGTVQNSTTRAIYNEMIQKINKKEFCDAITFAKNLIDNYPNSQEAIYALNAYPFLEKANYGCPESIYTYLATVTDENLSSFVKSITTSVKISNKEYNDAISLLEEAINNPENDTKKMLAQLDAAYCYYKMALEGYKSLPNTLYKPLTLKEYQIVEKNILDKLLENNENNSNNIERLKFKSSNYPNPFNPETNISFSLPQDSHVELAIYNSKGQKVKKLMSEKLLLGAHSVLWNGKDSSNKAVASGIYFYKIKTNNGTLTKKMLLIK